MKDQGNRRDFVENDEGYYPLTNMLQISTLPLPLISLEEVEQLQNCFHTF